MASSAPTASEWLARAAGLLGTADPCAELDGALDRALPESLGSRAPANSLLPGMVPFELSFSEAAPDALRFDFEPLGWGAEATTRFARDLIARRWGAATATAFEERASAASAASASNPAAPAFGSFAGAVFDASGLCEAKAYYLGAGDPAAADLAAAAREVLPGLEPLIRAVGVAGGVVAERDYLVCRSQLDLPELGSLLARLGMARRTPALLLALARLAGRAELAPGSAVIGLRRGAGGPELKVELPAAGLPGDPLAAVSMLLAERPGAHAAFRRWLAAVALPGMRCRASVVSARVTAASGVRLSAYVHPEHDESGERREWDERTRTARVG